METHPHSSASTSGLDDGTATILPGGAMRRVELDPETYRRKQARAWKAKTEAARVRHELNLTQDAFAELLGVSLATVRKWERDNGEPSGATKTLLAVARLNPEVIRKRWS